MKTITQREGETLINEAIKRNFGDKTDENMLKQEEIKGLIRIS